MFGVFTIVQKHHDVSFKELEIKKIRRGAAVTVHISLFLSTLKPFCSVLCVLNFQSRAKTLQNITRSSNNEALELWSLIRWQVVRTCRWHASSIISALAVVYMRYPPPVLINRCDLTERITQEPSLIWLLFPSGPGDRRRSHIPLTLESL